MNDEQPPKRVVENLFLKHKKTRYVDTIDAPLVLGGADLATVETSCPAFANFASELRALIEGNEASLPRG